jgi:hypothetical protein
MNVDHALKIIPSDATLTAETRVGVYGTAWNIVARMPGYERVVTSFATSDPFSAAHWVNEYDRQRDKVS